jgi:hypothetical protein
VRRSVVVVVSRSFAVAASDASPDSAHASRVTANATTTPHASCPHPLSAPIRLAGDGLPAPAEPYQQYRTPDLVETKRQPGRVAFEIVRPIGRPSSSQLPLWTEMK